MKYCPRCSLTLSYDNFHKNKSRKDGVQSFCKPCFKQTQKVYVESNQEKVLGRLKNFRDKNKDYFSNWAKLNRSKRNQQQAEREHKKRNATPSWLTVEQRKLMENVYWLARDLTVTSGEAYHVDHIVPIKGKLVCGLHVPWNLQILPSDLNLSKGNKFLRP
jgi:hypothetical protein